ncbi:helix-turn-helix domain-containing protein [Parasulfitobacter algicola]|uniref:DUF4115 domain-containing protein n=1 Tax=Parasulfitobacter algicola TaxID=2614809 RepID=A0ABX2IS94_9RHOB|nr:RodZ domain-containing protein [Sulfitobacter algicola]NSX55773.1 DUF4115 domain-containing protein [Sulfitobacter algicola]
MIGRKTPPLVEVEDIRPKGFDDYEVRLGDVMRGERATFGKSLLDVQRELKIKASYIAAIENADTSAFESPGFIAGYVRSYARYLRLDPEWAYDTFCKETGFATAHGMSAAASSPKIAKTNAQVNNLNRDPFEDPNAPFVPLGEGFMSRIEVGAIGSSLVLLALIAAIGYGGWSVLQQVQKVQFTPIEQAPDIVANIDPLASDDPTAFGPVDMVSPQTDALDRLYRPQALDVPVLVARDAPISTIDPSSVGAFPIQTSRSEAVIPPLLDALPQPLPVQVLNAEAPEVVLFAIQPTWVRVQAADQSILFEKILDAGEEYVVPSMETPPVLRAGNSGSLYFKVNGEPLGPAGAGSSTIKNVTLSPDALTQGYTLADPEKDKLLFDLINIAEADRTTQ